MATSTSSVSGARRPCRQALLADTGLDPQRVFLVRDGKVTPQDGKVRFELAMQ